MICEPEDEDYSSDEDEDYLPSGEASEGESEDDDLEEEGGGKSGEVKDQQRSKVKKGRSKKKRRPPELKRNRTGGIRLAEEQTKEVPAQQKDAEEDVGTIYKQEELQAAKMRKEEKQKQKADDLWSSFLKDVGQKPKAKTPSSGRDSSWSLGAASKQVPSGTNGLEAKPKKNETTSSSAGKKTVTVTKVFDFAGEEVKVTKEVAADSKEAKEVLLPNPPSEDTATADGLPPKPTTTSTAGSKRPGGGLSNVLGMINKKPKISVLEKSRLDWSNFTTKEGITDELKLHNKGKEGYIEKQKFLAQADQRQYEKERDLRLGVAKR